MNKILRRSPSEQTASSEEISQFQGDGQSAAKSLRSFIAKTTHATTSGYTRARAIGSRYSTPVFVTLTFALAIFILVRTAWLCDDAYITFRSVDNFVNGYGPVWNVSERVQSFTHPLWMLLMSAIVYVTREVYFSSLGLSITLTLATFAIIIFGIARSKWLGMAIVVVLLFSRSFVDYSTGGLENPLTHFLLALFAYVYLRDRQSLTSLFILSLLAALCTLNRMDTILFAGPALAWAAYERLGWRAVAVVVAGFMPLIAWEVFSIIYYGFPIPNSAQAKLGAGLTTGDKLELGRYFYSYTWKHDPLTLPAILIGLAFPLILKDRRQALLSVGVVLYLGYILWVGGVYMGGRMFTPPLLLAGVLVTSIPMVVRPGVCALAVAVAALMSLAQPFAPITTNASFGVDVARPVMDTNSIDDCRQSHYEWTGLLRWVEHGKEMPVCGWADTGRSFHERDVWEVHTRRAIGVVGYLAGPKIHFIDYYALADPLLARMPAVVPWWRTCHYGRAFPEGYQETLASGLDGRPVENQLTDPELAEFYDHLCVITRGPLFSVERFKTILWMNLGFYDHLVDRIRYRFPDALERPLNSLQAPIAEGSPWRTPGTIDLSKTKLRIPLDEVTRNGAIEISLDHNDEYDLYFFRDNKIVAVRTILPRPGLGMAVHNISVPWPARLRGYSDIVVVPESGDGRYSIGHLHLKP